MLVSGFYICISPQISNSDRWYTYLLLVLHDASVTMLHIISISHSAICIFATPQFSHHTAHRTTTWAPSICWSLVRRCVWHCPILPAAQRYWQHSSNWTLTGEALASAEQLLASFGLCSFFLLLYRVMKNSRPCI